MNATSPSNVPIDSCIHPKETLYFRISLAVSIVVYLILTVTVFGIVYAALIAGGFLLLQGAFTGRLRGNGVRVSPQQFPKAYALTETLSHAMGLRSVPSVYIVQEGGVLNAFATRFLGRGFVVIYSDMFELAYESGEAEVAFVLAHELAHLRLGHLQKRTWLYPAAIVPFLAQAYARATEYSCDAVGALLEPQGAVGGLLALAAGKRLYREVNLEAYAAQANEPSDIWMWLGEHLALHPNLPKRLRAIAQPQMGRTNVEPAVAVLGS